MRKMVLALLCAFLFIAAPARAQQTHSAGYKDPGIATLVSVLIPGGGQLYSGETRKGLTLLGVGVGAPTLGLMVAMSSPNTSVAPLALASVAALGAWVYGIADASSSAQRMNTQRGLAGMIPDNVAPVVAPNGNGGTQVGLTMRF